MPNIERVRFKNYDMYWEISADLYFPTGFDKNKQHPVIVIAHPIGACKDQTAGRIYAARLAEQGFLALAFDASFQGGSGGEPRWIEDPTLRVEDFSHIADFLVTLPYVDPDRIGVVGICGGGGYAVNAAMTERRYRVVATVTGANYGRHVREGRGSSAQVIATLDQIAAQRTAEARGAALQVDQSVPTPEQAAEWGITDVDALGGIQYYRTPRGANPNGANRTLRSHTAAAYGWDAFHLAELLLTQPLLVIIGDVPGAVGAYRDGYELIRRSRSEKKELFVVKGASHFDLYDQDEPVTQAITKLVPFLSENL